MMRTLPSKAIKNYFVHFRMSIANTCGLKKIYKCKREMISQCMVSCFTLSYIEFRPNKFLTEAEKGRGLLC